ncbi:MAG: type III secretion system inner membrane ring subunit SctD [Chthoniobacterales bacterium]|nr:type III secretion system inner membrane ring subunit SctD [Chthoniobacterales bacterium]
MNEKPWLIKVLNGPNAGAQLLVSKEITMGTSIDCDLVLHDPHICAHHCSLKKSGEDFLEIAPKEGLIFINGHQVSQKTAKLQLGEVLTLGSTHLTAGPSQQLWPSVTIPEIQEIGGVPKPIEATPKTSLAQAEPPENDTQQGKKRVFSRWSFFLLITIGFLMLLGIVLFRFVVHKGAMITPLSFRPAFFDKTEKEVFIKQSDVAEMTAQDLRKKFPTNTIKVISNGEAKHLFVYVRNQREADEVRRFMNENVMPIPSNIINIDDIDDSALAMMSSMNLAVSVEVNPDTGKVTWKGYLPDQALLEAVKGQIARDLPAITEEEFHIVLGTTAIKTIHDILEKNQLPMLRITPGRKDIALTGTIGVAGAASLQQTLQEIEKAFDGEVNIANMVTINHQAMRSGIFSSPVVSASISASPYLVLQNGERIFLGAKVQDGYIVNAITTEGIELINQAGKKVIPISGEQEALF